MIEFLNTMILLPYNLFAYLFGIVMWWLLITYTIHWYRNSEESDFFQYKFNRGIDWISDKLYYFRGRVLDFSDNLTEKFRKGKKND